MAIEKGSEKGAGRMAWQRRWVCLAVAMIGAIGALHVQRNSLSLQTAPAFAAGLLALLAAGEITVRILDWRRHKEGHAEATPPAEERVGALLEGLSASRVVLHHVCAAPAPIEHLVFRPDGVVFLVETQLAPGTVAQDQGELRLNGQPLPRHLFTQARRKVDWLRDFLRAQLGCEARLEAGLVFSNATVAAGFQSDGVALLGLEHLEPWLDTAEPDDEFGKRLWPQMDRLKTELLSSSESPSWGTLALPLGVVLLLGIAWLAISTPSAAKPPVGPAPVAQPAPKAATLSSGLAEPPSTTARMKGIHLEGLSGAPPRRLAIINGKTVAPGESAIIKVAGRDVLINCVSILGESATITVSGVVGTTELHLKDEL